MFVPLLLLGLAVVSAGVVAYGTNAFWAQFPHGIEVILWSRRLEWPLVTLCLFLCLGVLALVISGKRRTWWLIGLGPVLALFAHRFVTDLSGGAGGLQVVENPTFVAAKDAAFVSDDDYVVGLKFGDSAYAYPYSCLYYSPVVIQSDHDRRLMLIWSAFANRAVAETVTRELKARDLEIVSMPANAMLLYNHTYGQFINGIKGQLMNGQKPLGFGSPVVVNTMTWKDWHGINPDTRVLAPGRIPKGAHPPTAPILPTYPMPPAILDHPITTPIVLVGTTQPAALLTDQVGREPEHVTVDGQTAFVFREGPDKPVRAFSCFLKKQQLFTRFHLNDNSKYKAAMFVDTDTGSAWSANGAWLDGIKEYRQEFKGTRLAPVPVQDHLYWGVMKFWYPELQLTKPEQDASGSMATSGS